MRPTVGAWRRNAKGRRVRLTSLANQISFKAIKISYEGITMTEFLDIEDGRIAYDVTGSGPLVVLSPGIGDRRRG